MCVHSEQAGQGPQVNKFEQALGEGPDWRQLQDSNNFVQMGGGKFAIGAGARALWTDMIKNTTISQPTYAGLGWGQDWDPMDRLH